MAEKTKIYNFNSVGNTANEEKQAYSVDKSDISIGIATPIRESQGNSSLFFMNTTLTAQIRDNFRNMLSTNHGERLMLGDFGANLKPLAYELGSDAADTQAVARITKTTNKYMPYISLSTFESLRDVSPDGSLTKIGVRVTFSVPSLNVKSQTVEAIILSSG